MQLSNGRHDWTADEPTALGGTETGQFAMESHNQEIADFIRSFLNRKAANSSERHQREYGVF